MTDSFPRTRRPRRLRAALALLCGALLVAQPGCAALTGLVTGAFTGAVDAPAEVYRTHRLAMDDEPVYWPFNVLFFGPVGLAAGPLAGFAKGFALDIEWLLDHVKYGEVFGSYGKASVWRPYTIHW